MNLTQKHRTTLQRQIKEALSIEGSMADIILNKKSEWNGSKIPRLRVEVGEQLDNEERNKRGEKVSSKRRLAAKQAAVKRSSENDLGSDKCHKKRRTDDNKETLANR